MQHDKATLYKQVAHLLRRIKAHVHSGMNISNSAYGTSAEFSRMLDGYIAGLEKCSYQTLEQVDTEFLPTSNFQEISLDNG